MSTWTQRLLVEDEELVVGGDTWLINGRLDIVWIRDRNADSDADGRRGRDVTMEDERMWELESATNEDGGGVGEMLAGADIPEAVRKAASEWAEAYTPAGDDGDRDDEREED